MRMTNTLRIALTTATVAAVSLVSVTAASASTTDPNVSEARIEKACARVPVISERVDDHIARLSGDAETKGSLLWLRAKADAATANGHAERAKFIENRLTVRTARLELLKVRATALDELQAMCDEHSAS
jgi:hypothetical protein